MREALLVGAAQAQCQVVVLAALRAERRFAFQLQCQRGLQADLRGGVGEPLQLLVQLRGRLLVAG